MQADTAAASVNMPKKPKDFINWDNKDGKKIDRSAFLYMDPKGDQDKFAQCATCSHFTGESCEILGKHLKVKPTDSCALYIHGEPDPSKKGSEKEVVKPEDAGFIKAAVRCENCVYGDGKRKICTLFESINNKIPDKFDLDPNIHPKGCCNAFVAKN